MLIAAGRLDEADEAWEFYEQARRELMTVQARIMKVIARLYGRASAST